MILEDFLTKYNGRYIDVDNYPLDNKFQCTDLIRQYLIEVLNVDRDAIKPVSGAKDIYEKYDNLVNKSVFERVPNTPTGVPSEGDIVVWSTAPYGHTAIFIEGDVKSFRSFDQNYPTGTPCHVQNHIYTSVLGWLKFKALPQSLDQEIIERANSFIAVCTKLGVAANKDIVLAEIEKLLTYEDTINKQSQDLTAKDEQIEEVKKEAAIQQERVVEMQRQNIEIQEKLADAQKEITALTKTVQKQTLGLERLSEELEELEGIKPIDDYSGFDLIIYGIKKLLNGIKKLF